METTLEYYLGIDVSELSDELLAAKWEILKQLREKEKDSSLEQITKLFTK